MRLPSAIAFVGVLACGAAAADPNVPRGGETGTLDVPDATTQGLGGGIIGAELHVDHSVAQRTTIVAPAVSLVIGLGPVEVGFAMRLGGMPGDPQPSPLLLAAAVKVHLLDDARHRPALAVDTTVDRINRDPVVAARLIASTPWMRRLRLAAMAGVELAMVPLRAGPNAGVAVTIAGPRRIELVLDGIVRSGGWLAGGALRWLPHAQLGLSLGVDWRPGDEGVVASVGIAFWQPAPPRPRRHADERAPAEVEAAARPTTRGPIGFTDDRPRFRLRIPYAALAAGDAGRHLQYPLAPAAPPAPPARPAPPAPLATPASPATPPPAQPPPATPPPAPPPPAPPPPAPPPQPTPRASPAPTRSTAESGDEAQRYRRVIRQCTAQQLLRDPSPIDGTLILLLDEHGRVRQASVRNLDGSPLERCLQQASVHWQFAAGPARRLEIHLVGVGAP